MITIYTKDNCPSCVNMKATLDRNGAEYVEVNIGKDITREEFMEKFPGVRTVPHLVNSGDE